jgi:RNA polymerase sigma factor (sigma-70 family)
VQESLDREKPSPSAGILHWEIQPMDNCKSDGELVQEYAVQRCDDSFAELVRRHGQMVRKTCQRITGSEHDADDLTQAVFTLLASHAPALVDHTSLGGWLYRTAWHVSSRLRRETQRRRRRELSLAEMRTAPRTIPPETADIRAALALSLSELSEPQRELIVLYHMVGLTLKQIGQMTGESVGTIGSRLSRARANLRERLGERGVTLAAFGWLDGSEADSVSTPGDCGAAYGQLANGIPAAAAIATPPAVSSGSALRRRSVLPATALTSGAGGGIAGTTGILATLRVAAAGLFIAGASLASSAAAFHLAATGKSGPHPYAADAGAFASISKDVGAIFKTRRASGGGSWGSASVPEPGSAAIAGGAIAALGLRPRRAAR